MGVRGVERSQGYVKAGVGVGAHWCREQAGRQMTKTPMLEVWGVAASLLSWELPPNFQHGCLRGRVRAGLCAVVGLTYKTDFCGWDWRDLLT